jgi:GYF domain 2
MGIRFFCPNGHRLHVKTFLAGKRGICPDCGLGVDIPLHSDPVALKRTKEVDLNAPTIGGAPDEDPEIPLPPTVRGGVASGAPLSVAGMRTPVNVPSSAFSEMPQTITSQPLASQPIPVMAAHSPAMGTAVVPMSGAALQPASPQPVAVQPTPVRAMNAQPATAAMPVNPISRGTAVAPAPPAPVSVPMTDPIQEAPQAIWYVRPATGGQYGPARGDMMRGWLSEGRVSADSLVWREGWPDWRAANKVFPNLGAPAEGGFQTPVVGGESGATRVIRPQRKNSSTSVAIVVMLGLVAVGLAVALFFVLNPAK